MVVAVMVLTSDTNNITNDDHHGVHDDGADDDIKDGQVEPGGFGWE